ncbi:hypothetical protein DERP_012741 [Dermatophagoides pteronyssinus]|uniref:Uncharacterized protein n=1 Tax=Dermatophagoides pteronyssinus TaxID=6956 RepID=A0ABQ8JQF4_DERPT|nr:hypothetical protein DERP_012741 [Dermatophagoides pteronyssinus]
MDCRILSKYSASTATEVSLSFSDGGGGVICCRKAVIGDDKSQLALAAAAAINSFPLSSMSSTLLSLLEMLFIFLGRPRLRLFFCDDTIVVVAVVDNFVGDGDN